MASSITARSAGDKQARARRRATDIRQHRPGDRQGIVATVLLVGAAVYFLVPVFWLVVSATKSQGDLFSSFGFWFSHFNLWANIRETVSYQNGEFLRWLLNSLIYAGSA